MPKVKITKEFRELENKYQLLKDLMDHIPDVIYFKDKKGRLLMVNEAHARGMGVRPEQVVGKTDFDIFPKERAKKMLHDDQYVLVSGKSIIDKVERATRADGVDNYVSTTKIPRYNSKGEVIGLIGITRDITHRMQLKHLTEEKEATRKKLELLEGINKLKSDFVSTVSHELRIPLAIIKEAVSLVSEGLAGPITQKQEQLLVSAGNNIKRLQHIIEQLLDISRIETGRLKLHYSLVNLNDLILDSSEFFKKLAENKNIKLSYYLPKKEVNIFADAERIIQVINNLVSNAIKFTEEDGEVKIEVRALEDRVRVGIIDTGAGITKQDLPKLFNKFVQVSKISSTEKKGVGLGLSIVKELVQKHNGQIWAESRLGVGSKFYFTLPLFYTLDVLDKGIRDKLNKVLKEGKTVYFITLCFVNFKEATRKTGLGKLFNNLRPIVNEAFKPLSRSASGDIEVVWAYPKRSEYNVIIPGVREKEISRASRLLKNRIEKFFKQHKLKNIFINIGQLSFLDRKMLQEEDQIIGNIYFKKIYIGLERRKFKRVSFRKELEISGLKNKKEQADAVDISRGGVCFQGPAHLKTDERIKIGFNAPDAKKVFSLDGRVAWVGIQDAAVKNKYKVGTEFTGLKAKERKEIAKLARSAA